MKQNFYKRGLYLLFVPSLFFLFVSIFSWNSYLEGMDSNNWKITQGVILSNNIVKDEGSPAGNKSPATYTSYSINLKYEYTIKNKKYIGNIISYKTAKTNKKSVLAVQKKYPINKNIKVYYNPKNYHKSVLETGSSLGPVIIFTLISISLILFNFYFLYKLKNNFNLKKTRKKCN